MSVRRLPRRGLTRKELLVLCAINLVDCINTTILLPYADAMVSKLLGRDRGDPSVAMWVAVLVGSYSVCEVLFSGLWGMLADHIGRKPVLLLGLAGSAVAPVVFGSAGSLPVALAARVMDGFFCGNVGVTRTYLGELVDASNEAKAFGSLSLTFSFGIFLGPTLGGTLSDPASWAPQVFGGTIFDRRPYLLGNLVYSCFAVFALLLGFYSLEETRRPPSDGAMREALALSEDPLGRGRWSTRMLRLLGASSLLSGYTAARINAFVLVTSLPGTMNGLAYSPQEFGCIQVCSALVIFFNQLFLYQPTVKRFGPHRTFVFGLAWTILLTLPFPAFGLVADEHNLWRYVPAGAWQAFSQPGFSAAFPTVSILINRECPSESRGAINGWANSLNALSRGLCPLLAGGLVSLGCQAEQHVWGGRYVVFYVNMLLALASMYMVQQQSETSCGRTSGVCAETDSCEMQAADGEA